MKKKREENGESYLTEFAYGDSRGISVFNLNIGRLFSTSWELVPFGRQNSNGNLRPSNLRVMIAGSERRALDP
jgi:hypothetical protein